MTNTREQFALVLAAASSTLASCRTSDSEHRKVPGILSNQLGLGTLSPSGNTMDDMADAEAILELMRRARKLNALVSKALEPQQFSVPQPTHITRKVSGLD